MRNHLSRSVRLGIALLLLLGLACDLPLRPGFGPLGEEAVRIRTPPPPPAWGGLEGLRFRLEYRSREGPEAVVLEPGAEHLALLPAGGQQAVLAWPIWRGAELLPAGGRYPEELEAGGEAEGGSGGGAPLLSLDFPGGFVASVQAELRREGFDPRAFNLERLERELGLRVPDPWSLDRGSLLARLSGGVFSLDGLRVPPPGECRVEGPGPWVGESPFAPTAEVLPDGGWLLRGAAGARVFLSPEGRSVRELR